jgi:hypothetical protein
MITFFGNGVNSQADAIRLKGAGPELFRYCQQCGKVEPLSRFQANKRWATAAVADVML